MFFVAIIPPEDICQRITSIKNDFRDRFDSRHALRLVPHITLKAPFGVPVAETGTVVDWFRHIPLNPGPFPQALQNFKSFSSRRNPVIFIEPALTPELQFLQQAVLADFMRTFPTISPAQNEFRFHPHVTVGYRDLDYDNYRRAWKEYREKQFEAVFTVDNFCLMQHDKKQWNIAARRWLD